ncbi:catalase-related domain-containing protein [Latilactobacillus sp. VITA-14]|uniref:catalase-related domain-containing protein n=1 Tax=Latilactobacillus sp. VITA-14 TaxID=3367745 RepID=UPI003981FC1A
MGLLIYTSNTLSRVSSADKLYNLLTDEEQDRLIENIRLNLGQVTKPEIQIREVKQLYQADPEYGRRVATALNLDLNQFEH